MMMGMLVWSHVSPWTVSGVTGHPVLPCMSSHKLGVMKLYAATFPLVRWPARSLNANMWGSQLADVALGGDPTTSWKKTNGTCLQAYCPVDATGHVPEVMPSAYSR